MSNNTKQSRKKAAKAAKKATKKEKASNAQQQQQQNAQQQQPKTIKPLQPPPPDWKPTMDSLRGLACIQHLGLVVKDGAFYNPKADTKKPSLMGHVPTGVLESILEERNVQAVVTKILKEEKAADTSTMATSVTIRELKDRSEQQTVATTRAISKHYRRASIQVHPDRYGETFRAEFDALSKAHAILGNEETRKDYLDTMLACVQKLEDLPNDPINNHHRTVVLEQAHVSWMSDYETKQHSQDNDRVRAKQAKNEQAAAAHHSSSLFRLEGGLTSQMPRRMHVTILRDKRSVRLGCPFLRPGHIFVENCHSISIMAVADGFDNNKSDHHDGSKDRLLYKLQGAALQAAMKDAELHVTETLTMTVKLPDWGIWSLYWHATVRNDDNNNRTGGQQLAQTCSSKSQEVDMTHPQILKWHHELPILINQAKRHAGLVKAACGHHASGHGGSHHAGADGAASASTATTVEQTYWHMHQTMAKARSTALRLAEGLRILYNKDDTKEIDMASLNAEHHEQYHVLQTLKSRLDDATAVKATLEEQLAVQSQKDSLKRFKRLVGTLLESGEAATWIANVTPEQLYAMMSSSSSSNSNAKDAEDEAMTTTSVNRLYQILVEGKKANSTLAVDVNTLTRASERSDLFSAKQCETLRERAVLAEQMQAAEREELLKAAQEEQKAEAARKAMEKRAQSLPCTRGSLVQLQGLHKRPELNGTCGVFMGIDTACTTSAVRYCIRLYAGSNGNANSNEDRDVSLLAKNFAPWDQLQSAALKEQQQKNQQQEQEAAKLKHSGVEVVYDDESDDDDDYEEEPAMSLLFPLQQEVEIKGENLVNASPIEPLMSNITISAPEKTEPSKPTSWQCAKCTFLHEGHLVILTECDLCGAPAPASASSSVNSTAITTSTTTTGTSSAAIKGPARPQPVGGAPIPTTSASFWSSEPPKPQAPIARPTTSSAPPGAYAQRGLPSVVTPTVAAVSTPVLTHAPKPIGRPVAGHSHVSSSSRLAAPVPPSPASNANVAAVTTRSTPFKYPPSKVQKLSNGRIIKATAYIRNKDVALFIGQKGKHVKQVVKRAGISNLAADQKHCIDDSAGVVFCPVRIEGGTLESVQTAVTIVEDFAKRQVPPPQTISHNAVSRAVPISAVGAAKPIAHQPAATAAAWNAPQRAPLINHVVTSAPQPMPNINHVVTKPQVSKTAAVPSNAPTAAARPTVEAFLRKEKACFKCSPQAFLVWLQSQDVWKLEELAEAVEDDDFVKEMQANGLKGFKRNAFKKAVEATQQEAEAVPAAPLAQPQQQQQQALRVVQPPPQQQQQAHSAPRHENPTPTNGEHEIPNELLCPISHNLLVNDPVVAKDGYTYERAAIEAWFEKKAVIGGSVRSPMVDVMLTDLTLVPNASIKSMARHFARTNPQAL